MSKEKKPFEIKVSEEQVDLLDLAVKDYEKHKAKLDKALEELRADRVASGEPFTSAFMTSKTLSDGYKEYIELFSSVALSLRTRGRVDIKPVVESIGFRQTRFIGFRCYTTDDPKEAKSYSDPGTVLGDISRALPRNLFDMTYPDGRDVVPAEFDAGEYFYKLVHHRRPVRLLMVPNAEEKFLWWY